ncbi:MAG: helix-turn-helix domain-containing protein [Alphaproteobacteria bacterium]|nr:helix-turn-helix domain-containing protein [Alphaproteobacteria bacterium]
MESAETLLKVRDVCQRTSLSPYTIRRLVTRGELRPAIFGGRFLFASSEVQRWIDERLAARPEPPQGVPW